MTQDWRSTNALPRRVIDPFCAIGDESIILMKRANSPPKYKLRPMAESTESKQCRSNRRKERSLKQRKSGKTKTPKYKVMHGYVYVPNTTTPRKQKRSAKKQSEETKNAKITKILDRIELIYRERGVYNKMYETSEGSQVIRVDVRSLKALQFIEKALLEIDQPPKMTIVSVSTRYSCKKNGKKKGFNLFLKFENNKQRALARLILESYCKEEQIWFIRDIPPKILRDRDEASDASDSPREDDSSDEATSV